VEQVVHDYGDLCQAITELAIKESAQITADEFHTLNRCLDNAIASAVTEFGHQRDLTLSEERVRATSEALGNFAHEQRNLLNTALLALRAIRAGKAGFAGATAGVLDRSLRGLGDLIDSTLANVRLSSGMPISPEVISLSEFITELKVAAAMEAQAKHAAAELDERKAELKDRAAELEARKLALHKREQAWSAEHPAGPDKGKGPKK